jgi:hypothetical protein
LASFPLKTSLDVTGLWSIQMERVGFEPLLSCRSV